MPTRIPTQKRSIEKRNRIIEKGFALMCDKGYYNTNTNEIADAADVSIGILYQYFNDKKEIFIEGIKVFAGNMLFPLNHYMDFEIDELNEETLNTILDFLIKNHTLSKKAQEEITAMSHLDDDIAELYKNYEIQFVEKLVLLLKNKNITIENPFEKLLIAFSLCESFVHEIIYHHSKEINYETLRHEVVRTVINTLK